MPVVWWNGEGAVTRPFQETVTFCDGLEKVDIHEIQSKCHGLVSSKKVRSTISRRPDTRPNRSNKYPYHHVRPVHLPRHLLHEGPHNRRHSHPSPKA